MMLMHELIYCSNISHNFRLAMNPTTFSEFTSSYCSILMIMNTKKLINSTVRCCKPPDLTSTLEAPNSKIKIPFKIKSTKVIGAFPNYGIFK